MAAYTTITLDTLAPQAVAASINSGAAFASSQDVTLGVTTSDGTTSGYQMKIWGDVDLADNASIQDTEANSSWISYAATQAIKLSAGDGVKTLTVRLRDDVNNPSGTASDTITLDASAPVPGITVAVSPTKISKQTGKRTAIFEWATDVTFEQYEVRVVPSTASTHTAGTLIGTSNGSSNTSGSAGGYPASTNIVTTIDGADLEAASAGDGAKIVKVFVVDSAGNWSV